MVKSWIYTFIFGDMNDYISLKGITYDQWRSFKDTFADDAQSHILDL